MIKLYPAEIDLLFKQYPNVKRKTKVKSKKISKLKKVHKNRNNTVKAENAKAAQLLEKYLNFVPSENNVVIEMTKNISDIDITSALLRWGLVGKKIPTKYENKDVRKNAVKRARERKSVLQSYDFEKENKEANLQSLVAELEKKEDSKTPMSLNSLAAWVILMKSFDVYSKELEVKKLQLLAIEYFKSGKIADNNFAQKINAEKQAENMVAEEPEDLQDIYELNHKNMNLIINMINQKNR